MSLRRTSSSQALPRQEQALLDFALYALDSVNFIDLLSRACQTLKEQLGLVATEARSLDRTGRSQGVIDCGSEDYEHITNTARWIVKGNDQKPIGQIYAYSRKPLNQRDQKFASQIVNVLESVARRLSEEKKLRRSEARFSTLFAAAADGIILFSPDGKLREVNQAAECLLGYTQQELKQLTFFDILAPESHSLKRKMIAEKMAGRHRTIYEAVLAGKDGGLIPVSISSSSVKDNEGKIDGIVAIVHDLRSRKMAEGALLESEARFRGVVESGMVGIVFGRLDGTVTEANATFRTMMGYTEEDIMSGQVNWMNFTPAELAVLNESVVRRLEAGQQVAPYEKEYTRKDGQRIPVLVGSAMLPGSKSEAVAFVLDISERKQLQQQFQHAQKMEAVGQLAAGIAHDFNNILMGISSFSELLHILCADDPKRQAYTQQILAAATRGAELVEQLLVFGRKHTAQLEPVSLRRLLQQSEALIRQLLSPRCNLSIDIKADDIRVLADHVLLEQVLLNLASNARDAMAERGGTLTITAEKVHIESAIQRSGALIPPGFYGRLTLADSGCGIAPEQLAKIFEPFFTTKATGEGTGLGLSMVYGVIKECSGFIFVDSELGRGTMFEILLPLTVRAVGSAPVAESSPSGTVAAHILLVDDELHIRTSVEEYLTALGHTIFPAKDAADALAILRSGIPIDLLLTDVVMPGMSGLELAKEARRIRPAIEILFMSGYPGNKSSEFKDVSGHKILAKPVALGDLATAIANQVQHRDARGGKKC